MLEHLGEVSRLLVHGSQFRWIGPEKGVSHITDALTRDEALGVLRAGRNGKETRIAELEIDGVPAYTTEPGWLGYSDEKMLRLIREAPDLKFHMITMKVTGEAVQNRIVFKQLLRAGAIDVMQIDATRVAGPGENVANLLLASKFGVPVCPRASSTAITRHLCSRA